MSDIHLSPHAHLDDVAFRILYLSQAGRQLAVDAEHGELDSSVVQSLFDTIAELSMPLACRLFDQRRAAS